jgi:hypothetical protein
MFNSVISTLIAACLLLLSACSAPPGPRYRSVSSYSEGLAAVQHSGGQWGFVNERQEWAIKPRFEEAKSFQSGRAAVRQNGKWGFIDKRGNWL